MKLKFVDVHVKVSPSNHNEKLIVKRLKIFDRSENFELTKVKTLSNNAIETGIK
jgi:hypothetical protein